jgi:hypothetical protein
MNYLQLDLEFAEQIHTKGENAPVYVKEAANNTDLVPPADASSRCFADRAHRQYPCHTPAATWLSATTLAEKMGSYAGASAEGRALLKAAALHGILADVDAVLQAPPQTKQAALADDQFTLVKEGVQYAPLMTPDHVQRAADWLSKNAERLTYAERRGAAERILAAAQTHQAELPEGHQDELEKDAGLGTFDHELFRGTLLRTELAARQAQATALTGLLKEAVALYESNPTDMETRGPDLLFEAWGLLRKEGGLPRNFHRDNPAALSRAEAERWRSPWRHVYEKSAIASLRVSDVADVLADEELKQVFPDGLFCSPEGLLKVATAMPADRQSALALHVNSAVSE